MVLPCVFEVANSTTTDSATTDNATTDSDTSDSATTDSAKTNNATTDSDTTDSDTTDIAATTKSATSVASFVHNNRVSSRAKSLLYSSDKSVSGRTGNGASQLCLAPSFSEDHVVVTDYGPANYELIDQ